jgi:glutathione S-transferase
MMQIYWGSGSPYAWRVLLAAELKRIPYESKLLEFSKGQLKTAEFLAMSPRGKVPVIRDGDFVLTESLAILSYLDRKYPDAPLFGRTAEEAGRIGAAISDFESYLRQPLDIVTRWLFGDKPRTPEIDDANARVKVEIDRFENRIGRGPWLVGATPSAADIVWFPPMRILVRAGIRNEARTRELGWFPFADVRPNIGAFIARVETLPGYDKTFPPHWREPV